MDTDEIVKSVLAKRQGGAPAGPQPGDYVITEDRTNPRLIMAVVVEGPVLVEGTDERTAVVTAAKHRNTEGNPDAKMWIEDMRTGQIFELPQEGFMTHAIGTATRGDIEDRLDRARREADVPEPAPPTETDITPEAERETGEVMARIQQLPQEAQDKIIERTVAHMDGIAWWIARSAGESKARTKQQHDMIMNALLEKMPEFLEGSANWYASISDMVGKPDKTVKPKTKKSRFWRARHK